MAIVTGASSGIGREVTKQLALSGMIVIGCARNQSRIEVLRYAATELYHHSAAKLQGYSYM